MNGRLQTIPLEKLLGRPDAQPPWVRRVIIAAAVTELVVIALFIWRAAA